MIRYLIIAFGLSACVGVKRGWDYDPMYSSQTTVFVTPPMITPPRWYNPYDWNPYWPYYSPWYMRPQRPPVVIIPQRPSYGIPNQRPDRGSIGGGRSDMPKPVRPTPPIAPRGRRNTN